MTRRQLIVSGLAALTAPLFGAFQRGHLGSDELTRRVRMLLPAWESARLVGRRCLAAFDPCVSRAQLARAAGLAAPPGHSWTPAEDRGRLAVQREGDLRAGRVVLVDGWVLARSEAALLALAALV